MIRLERDLCTFIERSLQIKKIVYVGSVDASGSSHIIERDEKCTPRVLIVCSRDKASPKFVKYHFFA